MVMIILFDFDQIHSTFRTLAWFIAKNRILRHRTGILFLRFCLPVPGMVISRIIITSFNDHKQYPTGNKQYQTLIEVKWLIAYCQLSILKNGFHKKII